MIGRVVFLALLLAGCGGCPPRAATGPTADADAAGTASPPSSGAVAACANLRAQQCPEAETSDAGETCEQLLDRIQASGQSPITSACIADAHDKTALRVCHVRCGVP